MEVAAAFRSKVEKAPEGPDGIDVTGVLAGIGRAIAHLRPKAVENDACPECEHVQHGGLFALGIFAVIVGIVAVLRGRKQSQISPATLPGITRDASDRRF